MSTSLVAVPRCSECGCYRCGAAVDPDPGLARLAEHCPACRLCLRCIVIGCRCMSPDEPDQPVYMSDYQP